MEPDTTRESLILRVRDPDDRRAWEEFDGIYRPFLRQYGRARGVPDRHRDDFCQQCLSVIAREIADFRYDPARCRFRTWLRRIVDNEIRRLARQRSLGHLSAEHLEQLESPEGSPAEVFDKLWVEHHLRVCLEGIRPEVMPATFEAFEMYVLHERPVPEVCDALSMSPDQVYRIKWRVMQKLEQRLRALLGAEADDWLCDGG